MVEQIRKQVAVLVFVDNVERQAIFFAAETVDKLLRHKRFAGAGIAPIHDKAARLRRAGVGVAFLKLRYGAVVVCLRLRGFGGNDALHFRFGKGRARLKIQAVEIFQKAVGLRQKFVFYIV